MKVSKTSLVVTVVCLFAALLVSGGCQNPDPTTTAAPKPASDAKAPAPVQRQWKKIGPIGKGGGDV